MTWPGLFFAFSIFICCPLIGQEKSSNVIVVSATYCDGEQLFFSYQNYFGDHVVSNEIRVSNKWRILYSYEPLLVVFSRDFKLYPVFVLPGDTIEAKCNKIYGIEFFGTRGFDDLNALSIVENKIGFLWPSLFGIRITNKLNFQYLARSFDSLHIARNKMIDSIYLGTNQSTHDESLKIMNNQYADDYLRPFNEKYENFSVKEIPDEYTKKCASLANLINNDSMLHDRYYRSFIIDYNNFLARDSIISEEVYQTLYRNAKYFFTGLCRDFLLFHLMKKESVINEPLLVEDFHRNCKNSLYIDYIDSLIAKRNNLKSDSQVLLSTLSKTNNTSISFKEFLKLHRGKPIYIDFWASWCAPCIMEIGPLKELEKKFSKGIDFVSISIDANRSKWLEAISKNYLDSKNQLLMPRDSPIAKYFNIQDIPHFILLDRDGQVISLEAPRPSNSNEIMRTLTKLLKE